MQFTAFIIFFLALIAKICSAGLSFETFELDESLVEASIVIVESCYKNRLGTVGIAGPSAGSVMKRISSRETVISTTLIDETSRSVDHDPIGKASRYKLQVFVVTVSDSNDVAKTLGQVQNSKWWNHMASFLLIDSAKAGNGCSNADEVLWEAWNKDLLNSKFLCLHQTRGRLIYTFNPYTSKAPSTWRQEGTYKGIDDHVWTLFAREYDKDESRCDALDFDKTVDLGGYPIRATVFDDNGKQRRGYYVVTRKVLMSSLKVRWYIESTMDIDRPVVELFTRTADIHLFPKSITARSSLPSTYPIYRDELAVLTKYPGYKSQLAKLFSVLDRSSRFAVLAVLTITLLFFKFCLRQPLIPAILNLVLLICNAGIRGIPRQTAPRIYLASLFIFVVTIQGIYSGRFASLLTKNVRWPTVDSLEDLVESDHTIYTYRVFIPFFNQSAFEGREVVPLHRDNILYALFEDANSALLIPKDFAMQYAEAAFSHLSRDSFGYEFMVYMIREDWPLRDKVNEVVERLAASGILDYLHARMLRRGLRRLESYELQDREPEVKPLTLENLAFAFKILAFGLVCAIMVFIVEVATKDWY